MVVVKSIIFKLKTINIFIYIFLITFITSIWKAFLQPNTLNYFLLNLNFNHSFNQTYIFPNQPQLKVFFIKTIFFKSQPQQPSQYQTQEKEGHRSDTIICPSTCDASHKSPSRAAFNPSNNDGILITEEFILSSRAR